VRLTVPEGLKHDSSVQKMPKPLFGGAKKHKVYFRSAEKSQGVA